MRLSTLITLVLTLAICNGAFAVSYVRILHGLLGVNGTQPPAVVVNNFAHRAHIINIWQRYMTQYLFNNVHFARLSHTYNLEPFRNIFYVKKFSRRNQCLHTIIYHE